MQYIPQKNIKSATASFADSLLIVCYELSYPHFMERRGSLYFSSEHTAYSLVNLWYVCEAIYYEFYKPCPWMQKCSPEANASERAFLRPDRA